MATDRNEPQIGNDVRLRDLELAIQPIRKKYGDGAIMRLGEASSRLAVDVIPTGSLALDIALGVGGVPRGRIVEIFGPEMSGKSTLALHLIAEAQQAGGMAAYIDVEHALDPSFASSVGVSIEDLLVSQPDTGEQALEIAEALARSNTIDLIIVDSVAALLPRAEVEGEYGESQPGLQARLMSQAMRKLTSVISNSRTAIVFINQLREKIGVYFGNPEVTPGGRALKFASSVRIDLRRVESLKKGGAVFGNRVRARVVKNKVAPPFRTAEFDMVFDGKKQGISREGDILDLATDCALIKKQGSFYSYNGQRLGQGREQVKQHLCENPELAIEVENALRSQVDLPPLQGDAGSLSSEKNQDAGNGD